MTEIAWERVRENKIEISGEVCASSALQLGVRDFQYWPSKRMTEIAYRLLQDKPLYLVATIIQK